MTEQDIIQRLDKGQERFRVIDENMRAILRAVEDVRDEMKAMKAEVEKTKEIVEAWQTVKNAGRFTKWASGIVAAIGAAIGAIASAWIVMKGWWAK